MKVFILCALIAATQAAAVLHHGFYGGGASSQFRNQDNLGHYNFGYNEGHATGGTFRRESSDGHGNVAGSYGLQDADGRVRIVNYVADAAGFRADIKSNEPGVEPKDPAATTINKSGLVVAPAHHAVTYAHAPAPLYAHAPAPLYAHAPAPLYAHAPAPLYASHQSHHLVAPRHGYGYYY